MTWFILAILGAIFVAGMDFFIKKATGKIDGYFSSMIINICSVIPPLIVIFYLKFKNLNILTSKEGLLFSSLAGFSIGIGTILILKMFAAGTNLSIGVPIVRIGTVLIAGLLGVFLLKETISWRYGIGFLLSLIGLYLLIIK